MYYQYNNFTNRLIGANHMTPYFPVGPEPLSKNEPPKIMFETPYVKIAQESPRTAPRKMVPGTSVYYSTVSESLKKKMEHFQKVDGVPIFLKGGAADRALFGLTATLCVVGIVSVFHMIYTMSYPKKK